MTFRDIMLCIEQTYIEVFTKDGREINYKEAMDREIISIKGTEKHELFTGDNVITVIVK